jgi:glucan biosynthesis protein C
MTAPASQRYHSLDALRAAMMLLGIVLHSAASYMAGPLGAAWPYKDAQTNGLFDLVVFFIHLFRMPVFFVAAGFFGALLMERGGVRAFVANRAKRVLLPLVLFWPIVFIAVAAGFVYATRRGGTPLDLAALETGSILRRPMLAHLWFLWDLTILYAAAAVIVPIASRVLGAAWGGRVDAVFARLATTIGGVLAVSAMTAVSLLPMVTAGLDTSSALLPPVRILVAYGVFFTFGWLLYRRRGVLDALASRWKPSMAMGAVASVAYLAVLIAQPFSDPRLTHAAGCALAGVSMWLLIFGIVGMFVSLFERPSPLVRYLSDASYWMYIVHLPIVIAVPGVLAPSPLPAVVKFAITLTVTTAATLVTYHYLVRSTAIGALLNGRRYPRSLPAEVGVRSPDLPRGQGSRTPQGSGLQIRRARGLTPSKVEWQTWPQGRCADLTPREICRPDPRGNLQT